MEIKKNCTLTYGGNPTYTLDATNDSIFSVAMILMPIIAFAVMHVGAFLNKVFAETSFQMGIAQKGVQYIRSKNVFLLQE